jgi:DNA-binding transcriptional regulator PaaX
MSNARAAVLAGQALRKAIADYIKQHGPQTCIDLAEGIQKDGEVVRGALGRMIKAGAVRSERVHGKSGWAVVAIYHLVDEQVAATRTRKVSKPFQPTLKKYAPLGVRDPLALPPEFFERTAA